MTRRFSPHPHKPRYLSKAFRAYRAKYHQVVGIVMGSELYVSANREGFMRRYLAKTLPPKPKTEAQLEHEAMMAEYHALTQMRKYNRRIRDWPVPADVQAFITKHTTEASK